MRAITPTPERTTAGVTLDTLQCVLDGAKQRCPDLAIRLDKAAGLLATGRVQCGDTGRIWWVTSETDAEKEYAVAIFKGGPWVCNCPDFQRRKTWCKHGLAVALLKRCQDREGAGTPPPTAPAFRVLQVVA